MSTPGRTEQGRELSPFDITPNQALARSDRSYGYPRQYLTKRTERSTKRETVQHLFVFIVPKVISNHL
jgi:hypothetical protein